MMISARRRPGLTFLELILLLAILGVLAALVYPLGMGLWQSKLQTDTRLQFEEILGGVEAFADHYGRLPSFVEDPEDDLPAEVFAIRSDNEALVQVLAGQQHEGGAVTHEIAQRENPEERTFLTFPAGWFAGPESRTPGVLVDAFGNSQLILVTDSDGDGLLPGTALNQDADVPARMALFSLPGPASGARSVLVTR